MNLSLHRLLVAVSLTASLTAGFVAPALAQQGHNPFATPPAPQSEGWELVDQRDLGIEGELVALSPDGRHIAGIGPDGNRFCVWNVETGDPTCDEERQPVMQDSITWAPDGTAVAYSLNAHLEYHDSDIFVFELDAGRSVNLTDDGHDRGIPLGEEVEIDELPLDVYPGWSPDGQTLVFARTEWLVEQPTTELMTIVRAGGEPEPLATVRDDFPLAVASPVFPLADGGVLYSVFVDETEDRGNGVWRLDPDGEATRLLPGALGERLPLPAITDVREGSSGAVASGYSRGLANALPFTEPFAFEIDLDTGAVTPSAIAGGAGAYQTPFAYALDGASRIAIESRQTERHLVITDGDGGRTTDLGVHEGGRYTNSRGIDWAANNTILVPERFSGGLLLTVAPSEETPAQATLAATGAWAVTDRQELALDGEAVTLSPDGRHIAGVDDDRHFCVWPVATLEPACDAEPLPVDERSIAWAPDSTAVAFTLDTLRELRESDLFVFERDAGQSVNLTEDGIEDIPLGGGDEDVMPIDLYPAWAADSQSLTFARTDYALEDRPTNLMTIARDGGDPIVRYRFPVGLDWPISSPMFALADGSLVFALNPMNPDTPDRGLWTLDAAGEATQVMAGTTDDPFPHPVIADVAETAGGARVSGYAQLSANEPPAGTPFSFVLDLATGEATPLLHPEDPSVSLHQAGFSPDGQVLAALAWSEEAVELVMFDPEPSVMPLDYTGPLNSSLPLAPDWAANGTMLLRGLLGPPMLVTIAQEEDAAAPAAPAATGAWAVAGRQELDFDGQAVTLSPDGQWIAGTGPDGQLCVWPVATMEPACSDDPSRPDSPSIAWAPDSTAVAWALNATRYLEESDIFVYEVATGTTTNLTDDGVDGPLMIDDEAGLDTLPVDLVPAWAPDSQSLTFARIDWMNREGQTDLMTISREGGEPKVRHELVFDHLWSVIYPIQVLGDGSLVYAVTLNDPDDPDNGIWRLDPQGEPVQLMPGATGEDFPAPVVSDVLEAGSGVTITGYSITAFSEANGTDPITFTLDAGTGTVTPTDEGNAAAAIRYAPDGAATVAVRWGEDGAHLAIEDAAGGTDLGLVEVGTNGFGRGVDWAVNDTILVPNATGERTVLLTVERSS